MSDTTSIFTPGSKVNWAYTPRNGYEYSTPVAAIVAKHNPRSVTIAVWNRNAECVQFRNVQMDKLSPRTCFSLLDDKYSQQKGVV